MMSVHLASFQINWDTILYFEKAILIELLSSSGASAGEFWYIEMKF